MHVLRLRERGAGARHAFWQRAAQHWAWASCARSPWKFVHDYNARTQYLPDQPLQLSGACCHASGPFSPAKALVGPAVPRLPSTRSSSTCIGRPVRCGSRRQTPRGRPTPATRHQPARSPRTHTLDAHERGRARAASKDDSIEARVTTLVCVQSRQSILVCIRPARLLPRVFEWPAR